MTARSVVKVARGLARFVSFMRREIAETLPRGSRGDLTLRSRVPSAGDCERPLSLPVCRQDETFVGPRCHIRSLRATVSDQCATPAPARPASSGLWIDYSAPAGDGPEIREG